DLFYRLNVIQINVPPLRDRGEDLSKLVDHFVSHYAAKHGRTVDRCPATALATLAAYDFPGNARELANTIERAVIVATGKRVENTDLPVAIGASVQLRRDNERPKSLAEIEEAHIR